MKANLFTHLLLGSALTISAFAQSPEKSESTSGPEKTEGTKTTKRIEPTIAGGSYAADPECLFDFWKADTPGPAPLLIFIHGGGFKAGNRKAVKPAFIERALSEGYSVASIDYPFLDKKPVQEILPLCARAVQYARYNAKAWNIDPTRIGCLGGSAGAGTSLWIAAHPDLAQPDSSDPVARESTRIQAVASINGQATYDLLKWEQLVGPPPAGILRDDNEPLAFYHLPAGTALDSDAAKAVRAQVDIHGLIDKTTPPLFLFTAQGPGKKQNDRGAYVHSPRHSEALAAKAKELGLTHELLVGENSAGKDGPIEALGFFKKQFEQIKAKAETGTKQSKITGQFKPSSTPVYKTIGDVTLKLHVFNPPDHKAGDHRPAVVFFFGGGFRGGAPTQFYPHSSYFASRGLVAISAEYRIKNVHGTNPEQSVADAKSALRWVRAHARELGIDPSRIAAGGGSAGGFLAAATATLTDFNDPGESSVSPRPDALVIYNGIFDLVGAEKTNEPQSSAASDEAKKISPRQNIRAPFPPTAFFVGTQDKLVPVSDAEKIKTAVVATGGRFDLHTYEGQSHGFFNYNRNDRKYYQITLLETDRFLSSLGWLTGEPLPAN